MDRYFNTDGPCLPGEHYMLPPEARLPRVRELIDRGRYFVVHGPRQSGKTTILESWAWTLSTEGKYLAVRFSCETADAQKADWQAAERLVVRAIQDAVADMELAPELLPPYPWPDAPAGALLKNYLSSWAKRCPKPLVLFFDEIDTLEGTVLISVLRQLRDGYTARSKPFPHAVVLCGMRDVRDYKIASGGDASRMGTSSPFNIKKASLRLADFTYEELAELYGQHTEATGQVFSSEALQRAYHATRGQPWLVNALAVEVIENMGVAPPEPITDDHMDQAVERLILARATHLDSLVARLDEPRVKRLIEPMIAGTRVVTGGGYDEDASYVHDLGLITGTEPSQIANPIYQEVIIRVLGRPADPHIQVDKRSFITPAGRLDLRRLLEEFLSFWKSNGEVTASGMSYQEAACQLVFMAYLQRIVNGGGFVDREYGVGRGRIDLLVRRPYTDEDGKRIQQWEAIEIKVRGQGKKDPLDQGCKQLDGYLDRLGLDTGTLLIFDQRPDAPEIHARTSITEERTGSGRKITLVRA